jgi:hypothetical protein
MAARTRKPAASSLDALLSTATHRQPVVVVFDTDKSKGGFIEARDGGIFAVKAGGAGRPLLLTRERIVSVTANGNAVETAPVKPRNSAAKVERQAAKAEAAPVKATRSRKAAPVVEAAPEVPVAPAKAARSRKAAPVVEAAPEAPVKAARSRKGKTGQTLTVVPE